MSKSKQTLEVSKGTMSRLEARGKMGDSFDDVINRVLDEDEDDFEDDEVEE